jgi:hypothetical protein
LWQHITNSTLSAMDDLFESDEPWNILRSERDITVTGCNHFKSAASKVAKGDPVVLVRDLKNEAMNYHEYAVQVMHYGIQIGHVSRFEADKLGRWMDDSGSILKATGVVTGITRDHHDMPVVMSCHAKLRIDLNEVHKEMEQLRRKRRRTLASE